MKFLITVTSINGQVKFVTDVDTVLDLSDTKVRHKSIVSGVATDTYIRSALLGAANVDVGDDFFDEGELDKGDTKDDSLTTNL